MLNWLKQLITSTPDLPAVDLSKLEVDMHSHLIPAIDDGAGDLDDSLQMIRRFAELGYRKLITTPHVMSDFYKNDPNTIKSGLQTVQQRLDQEGISIELEAAAEYYLDENLEDLIEKDQLLTFGDKHLLFELPFISEPPNFKSIVFELQTRGYKPILAHPERYGYWYREFDKYRELADQGVYLQLNMLSLIGHYSPQTQKIAEQLVEEDLISFLGSDCHNIFHLELIEKARKTKSIHQLMESGKLRNKVL